MGMPKVSTEVIQSTSTSIAHGRKQFWKTAIEDMSRENPLVYQILTVSEASSKSSDFKEGYKRGACLIYAVLSRQAEADDMNEIWGLDSIEVEGKEVVKCACGSTNISELDHVEQGQKVKTKQCKDCGLTFF